jgi:hypothetical protein
MPFLNEDEWQQISSLLMPAAEEIKNYRLQHNCDLATARINVKPEAMKKFEEMTGVPGVHFDIIYHHRLVNWGPECKRCGHLFRTPNASFCANCGQKIEDNA